MCKKHKYIDSKVCGCTVQKNVFKQQDRGTPSHWQLVYLQTLDTVSPLKALLRISPADLNLENYSNE